MGSLFSRANLVGRSDVKPLEECMNSCLTSYGEECLAVQYAPLTSECWSRVGTDWSELLTDLIPWPNIRQYALCRWTWAHDIIINIIIIIIIIVIIVIIIYISVDLTDRNLYQLFENNNSFKNKKNYNNHNYHFYL